MVGHVGKRQLTVPALAVISSPLDEVRKKGPGVAGETTLGKSG